MDYPDMKMLSTDEMHKSAIIYRDDSASFIYVCFHCGHMFNEINDTLQHIESHFQLTNVILDQFNDDEKDDKLVDSLEATSVTETVDIKIEKLENNYFDDSSVSIKSEQINEDYGGEFRCKVCHAIHASKFLIRIHVLNAHILEQRLKCRQCSDTFKSQLDFENHLKQHIFRNEVNWDNVSDGIETSLDVDWS